jgi:hypothetical protein
MRATQRIEPVCIGQPEVEQHGVDLVCREIRLCFFH